MRPRSIARDIHRRVIAGCTCAPLESTHSQVNRVAGSDREARRQRAVPAGMRGFGGKSVFGHRCAQTSTVICSSTSALRGSAETPMAARTCRPASPKTSTKRSEAPLITLGESGKPGDGVDVAVDADDALDRVERAEVALQHGELRQRASPRGGVAFFDGAIEAGGSGDHAFEPVEITPARYTTWPTVFAGDSCRQAREARAERCRVLEAALPLSAAMNFRRLRSKLSRHFSTDTSEHRNAENFFLRSSRTVR